MEDVYLCFSHLMGEIITSYEEGKLQLISTQVYKVWEQHLS
jgi:hypothetical protein